MQYVERAIGSVSKTWYSINPATLSGGIDVIVVEHPDGTLACSPFHVRFGKFQILKPSQKKVEVIINGKSTNIPMKLGDAGEAYFVFETTDDVQGIPEELLSSPVMSATNSPPESPQHSNQIKCDSRLEEEESEIIGPRKLEEPDFLDINDSINNVETYSDTGSPLPTISKTKTFQEKLNRKLTQIHIPSKLDNNGDLLLDIEGYKPNKDKVHDTDNLLKQLIKDELGNDLDISEFVREDSNGNIRIVNPFDDRNNPQYPVSPPGSPPMTANESGINLDSTGNSSTLSGFTSSSTDADTNTNSDGSAGNASSNSDGKFFIKTLRLSSEQLKCLDLKYGENDLTFSVDQGRALVRSKLFVWRWNIPIVISDIDGTITKSDALGHVMTMFGKDWTHIGVAKLFSEIAKNGYNIMYLTARSTGQADSTRSYLRSIVQNGNHLPLGPVILSPDRTIAALRREVILKKPEVFKIACLNDMRSLYFDRQSSNKDQEGDRCQRRSGKDSLMAEKENMSLEEIDEKPTPFFAGFGNRITDALSYRTVGVPSSRIFTINPDGEVHMELLELAGYRSSYVFINELVDHFFPQVNNDDDDRSIRSAGPGSPINKSVDTEVNVESNLYLRSYQDEKFTDVNFWREPIPDLEELTDISDHDNDDKDDKNYEGKNDLKLEDLKNSDDTSFMLVNSPSNISSLQSSPIPSKSSVSKDRNPVTDSAGSIKSSSIFVPTSPSHINANNYSPHSHSSTPSRSKNRQATREDIGKQIYLELGSPLSQPQPQLPHADNVSEISSPEISGLSINENEDSKNRLTGNAGSSTHSSSAQDSDQGVDDNDEQEEEEEEEEEDDEFDEDEFT